MLNKIEIENFKSIYKESIDLGQVNVFIGENGCGKTNILEAVGMASAIYERKLKNDELALKGIRVTKPSITLSSFIGSQQKNEIILKGKYQVNPFNEVGFLFNLKSEKPNNIISEWKDGRALFEDALKNAQGESFIPLDNNEPEILKQIDEPLSEFKIYHLSTNILRGIGGISFEIPGIHGENLDLLINSFKKRELNQLLNHSHFISWLEDIIIDREGSLRLEGHNLNLSQSKLYFRDKFMQKKNNIFSTENANEGILHILFYLALFISKRTPKFFAIDNIETALNPHLCRALMVELVKLAKKNDKQVLITTHNPAILDGLNLHDDEVRLFTVSRNLKGHTKVERVKLKPDVELNGKRLKLSELWMRGHLGAIPHHF